MITFRKEADCTVAIPGREGLRARVSEDRLSVTYSNETVGASTMASLIAALDAIDAEKAAKAARAKALKDAEANPIPATMLHKGILVNIQVRGIHKSSGDYLIIDHEGKRTTARRGLVFRRLTKAEADHLMELNAATREAEVVNRRRVAPHHRENEIDATGVIDYDEAADQWVARVNGREFRDESVYAVQRQATRQLLGEAFPWTITENDTVVPSLDVLMLHAVFATVEEAEHYIEAQRAYRNAEAAYKVYAQTLRLNLPG